MSTADTMSKLTGIGLFLHLMLAQAEEIVVISSDARPEVILTKQDVADIYLDKGENPQHLKPYDQQDKQMREQFYREISGLSLASIRAYWAKRVFTGRGRPPVIIEHDQINQTFTENPNAITYTRKQRQPEHTKALFSIQLGEQ